MMRRQTDQNIESEGSGFNFSYSNKKESSKKHSNNNRRTRTNLLHRARMPIRTAVWATLKKNGRRDSTCKITRTKRTTNNQSKRYARVYVVCFVLCVACDLSPKLLYIYLLIVQMKENPTDMKDQDFEFINDEKEKEDAQTLVCHLTSPL